MTSWCECGVIHESIYIMVTWIRIQWPLMIFADHSELWGEGGQSLGLSNALYASRARHIRKIDSSHL